MSWDKRQLQVVAEIRKSIPGARVRYFGGGPRWTYEGDGPDVIVVEYTDQHLGAPPYLNAVHWTGAGLSEWVSDDVLPAPPVLPDSQMRKNIHYCTGVTHNTEIDIEARKFRNLLVKHAS